MFSYNHLMTDHSVYFEIALLPEDMISKENITFDKYLCNKNHVKYVVEYLNNLYSTVYYKSKGLDKVDYIISADEYGNKFNVNVKITADCDWTMEDWFKKEKLCPKAYDVLVSSNDMTIEIEKTIYYLKFRICECLGYVNCWDDDDNGGY